MTKSTTLLGSASALAALFVQTPAWAEDAHPDILVTGERLREAADTIAETPGGADLVTAEDYENRAAVSLRDALAFTPGIYAQPRFGQEVRLSIRGSGISRGFHMRGLTLLQDGIPLNLADDNGDFQELDPTILEHIAVYRGGNALRFGGSTLGGAINGVTPTGRTAPGIGLRLDGGSFNTIRGVASYGYADERGDAWVAVAADHSDGERDHATRDAIRFNGNIGYRLSEGVETRFYASAQSLRQELPGALALADALNAPRSGNFVNDQARDIDSLRLQNRTSFDFTDGSLEIGAFLNTKQLYHPIFQVVDQTSNDYGAFARVHWASGPFALTVGGDARFGAVDSRRWVNIDGGRGAATFRADQDAQTLSLYGEARFSITPSLTIIAGGIYSHGEREQIQTFPATALGAADFDEFSPKMGLLFEPVEGVQIYANANRSHEFPGFIELAQIASFVPLDPQTAWTFEIGTRGRIGIAGWDVSIYRADLDNELLQFTVGPDIPASTFNADDTIHRGIEAGLDLDFAPWARLRQIYQYTDFRFDGNALYGDNRLPVIPKHLYRAELRLGTESLNVAPAMEWVPDGAWADYANVQRVDGYAMIGLTAAAGIAGKVSLFLDVRNLTNAHGVGDISAVIDTRALLPFQQAIFYPIERRSVFGGVRARF
ncbi:TonB-dependent receptor family protein [Parasphingopyxis marina]|uniref:TonB-dependent receptor n=1 Tax=Parasphingopyxis marina TaxID=2761622 RepID=A0A842HWI1_9SPHN|nr:TonB-dependent receptor [Parasphingopyxis marina]MBC2776639.1 TonB-dependent receptor [Parasphingopyxis marina]